MSRHNKVCRCCIYKDMGVARCILLKIERKPTSPKCVHFKERY